MRERWVCPLDISANRKSLTRADSFPPLSTSLSTWMLARTGSAALSRRPVIGSPSPCTESPRASSM